MPVTTIKLISGHDPAGRVEWTGTLDDFIRANAEAFSADEIADLRHKLTYRPYRIGGGADAAMVIVSDDLEGYCRS